MIIGKVYEFVDKNRKFPFEYERGVFLGYTMDGLPRFILNVRNGIQCFINSPEKDFEEILFNQNIKKENDR